MKPVNDPDLLAQLNADAAPPPVPVPRKGGFAGAQREPEPVDPAEDMPWYEKALVGYGGATRDMYLGAKHLLPGEPNPDEVEERKYWEAKKHHLGGWGTAGGVAADVINTLPAGGVSTLAGKGVIKALPKAAEWAARGGNVANLGTAGRAAIEGATVGAVQGDADDKTLVDRIDNVLTGGAAGAALPLALTSGVAGISKLWKEFSPSMKASAARAADALEKTLGVDRVTAMKTAIENATPSRLPRTTAAVTQDARAGALERGARGRGNVDFGPHDEEAAGVAWQTIKDATKEGEAVNLEKLRKAPQEVFNEGIKQVENLPLSQANRKILGAEIEGLRTHKNVIANPELNKELDNVMSVLANKDAKLGSLPELWTRLNDLAGEYPAMSEAREAVKKLIDDKSKGQFSNIIQGYGATKDALKAAEAEAGIRTKFMTAEGVPTTEKYTGRTGPDAIPHVQSRPLRMALAKAEKSEGGPHMDPSKMEDLRNLSDELAVHEIYKPSQSMGSPGLAGGEGTATELSSGLGWKTRALLKPVLGSLNEKSQRIADEAMHDPQKFLGLMDSKRGTGVPLTTTEKLLDQALRGLSRETAVNTGD
jgi:hypothetical protein